MRRTGVRSDAASCANAREADHDWGYTSPTRSPNVSPVTSPVTTPVGSPVTSPVASPVASPDPSPAQTQTTSPTTSPNTRSLRHEESGLRGLVLSVPGWDIPVTSPAPNQARSPDM